MIKTLDSNNILPGIATYRPNSGITGKLLFPDTNKDLERPAIQELYLDKPKEDKSAFGKTKAIQDFFWKHLSERAVSYFDRSDMTTGRQMTKGTFESLQFGDDDHAGPFFGIPLRFGGESFGVLKIEVVNPIYSTTEKNKPNDKSFFINCFDTTGTYTVASNDCVTKIFQAISKDINKNPALFDQLLKICYSDSNIETIKAQWQIGILTSENKDPLVSSLKNGNTDHKKIIYLLQVYYTLKMDIPNLILGAYCLSAVLYYLKYNQQIDLMEAIACQEEN